MKKYKYLLLSIGVTVASILFLKISGKVNYITDYIDIIGKLTSLENESELLESSYAQQNKILEEKGIIMKLEDMEDFTKSFKNVAIKEVSVLKFIGEKEELIATVPNLDDAFSMGSGDMIRITFVINSDIEKFLDVIMLQKITFREIKVIPLSNEIQITFLI